MGKGCVQIPATENPVAARHQEVWGDGGRGEDFGALNGHPEGTQCLVGGLEGLGSKPHLPRSSRPARPCAEPGRFYPQVRIRARCTRTRPRRRPRAVQPAPGDEASSTAPETEKGALASGVTGGVGCAESRALPLPPPPGSRQDCAARPAEQTRGGAASGATRAAGGESLARCGRWRNSLVPSWR